MRTRPPLILTRGKTKQFEYDIVLLVISKQVSGKSGRRVFFYVHSKFFFNHSPSTHSLNSRVSWPSFSMLPVNLLSLRYLQGWENIHFLKSEQSNCTYIAALILITTYPEKAAQHTPTLVPILSHTRGKTELLCRTHSIVNLVSLPRASTLPHNRLWLSFLNVCAGYVTLMLIKWGVR